MSSFICNLYCVIVSFGLEPLQISTLRNKQAYTTQHICFLFPSSPVKDDEYRVQKGELLVGGVPKKYYCSLEGKETVDSNYKSFPLEILICIMRNQLVNFQSSYPDTRVRILHT